MSSAVDYWVDNILEGYITEFVIDTSTSSSEVEKKKFQAPRGRYCLSLKT